MRLPLSANLLQDLQWKNRILIIQTDTALKTISLLLKEQENALNDRDLITINLSKKSTKLTNGVVLSEKERAALRSKFKLTNSKKSQFILIGKDSGEKARQSNTLNLQELFALIDTMPMRKAEIRNKKQ